MPIYQYECRACGHTFEAMGQMSDDNTEVTCPSCRREGAHKVFSPSGTLFLRRGCAPRGGG
ncbi:MAG: zinc ribbon domain-containing protein [Chloroflexota bacterium]|nr:zinc ribbon domain-containing protein [Chloroflexota bacterium]